MAKAIFSYVQILEMLDQMSASQLKGVIHQCNKKLKQREQNGEKWDDYELGVEQGRLLERQELEAPLNMYIHEMGGLNMSIGLVRGAIAAGAGNAQKESVKEFAGMVEYWRKKVELTSEALAAGGKIYVVTPTDFKEEFDAAVSLFYVGGDPSGAFALPGDTPELLGLYETIAELKPGIGKDDVITRLCARARPYRLEKMSYPVILNQLREDLSNPTSDDEREELDHVVQWDDKSFSRAYQRRYPKSKNAT